MKLDYSYEPKSLVEVRLFLRTEIQLYFSGKLGKIMSDLVKFPKKKSSPISSVGRALRLKN